MPNIFHVRFIACTILISRLSPTLFLYYCAFEIGAHLLNYYYFGNIQSRDNNSNDNGPPEALNDNDLPEKENTCTSENENKLETNSNDTLAESTSTNNEIITTNEDTTPPTLPINTKNPGATDNDYVIVDNGTDDCNQLTGGLKEHEQ